MLEGDIVTELFAFSGFDVTFVGAIMLRRSAKVTNINYMKSHAMGVIFSFTCVLQPSGASGILL